MEIKRKRFCRRFSRLLAVWIGILLILCVLPSCGKSGGGTPETSAQPESASQTADAPVFETDPADEPGFCLMVYMIGSDLETFGGAATDDLQEMLAAEHSDRLQIVLQTGGPSAWSGDLVGKDGLCRRFKIGDDGLEQLEELGVVDMSEPAALTDFIRFASENYPADRFGLILWNRGAGTLMGYGNDEDYASSMLDIGDVKQALEDSDRHFYFIGFDACLMSTVEVASALEGHTDYLIASEETEPSGGWAYTSLLSQLAAQPDIGMQELSHRIVDDFVDDPGSTKYDKNTLAVLELAKLPAVRKAVGDYLELIREPLAGSYDDLSLSRSRTRSFGSGMYEQIDLLDMLDKFAEYVPAADTEKTGPAAEALRKALSDMTVYTRSVDERSSGLAVYFPYLFPDRYEGVSSIMKKIGYDEGYFGFFDGFLNYVVAEQERADVQPVGADTKAAPWYHPENVTLKEETYIDPSTLAVREGFFAGFDEKMKYIDLKGEQWKLIDQLENVIYVDTEEYGRLELGCMNLQHVFTDTGDPYYAFDGTWIALDDRIVPYYEAFYTLNEEEDPYSYGFIPAELDGNDISILVWFNTDNVGQVYTPEVIGYRREPVMSIARRTSVIDISAGLVPPDKGVHPFREGDVIRFYAYREDGSKAYPYDVPIVCHEQDHLSVSDTQAIETFAGGAFTTMYQSIALRDIFNNTYLCEGVELFYDWQDDEQYPEENSPELGLGPDHWDGPTETIELSDDFDVTLSYPEELFEVTEDSMFGEWQLRSRDGKVTVILDYFADASELDMHLEEELHYSVGHDYSREILTRASGMSGHRYLYSEDDGRWFMSLIAGSRRMRGGIYGYYVDVWSEGDPDEEMLNAIFFIGNSLKIGN